MFYFCCFYLLVLDLVKRLIESKLKVHATWKGRRQQGASEQWDISNFVPLTCFESPLSLVLPGIPQSLYKALPSLQTEANSVPCLITGYRSKEQGGKGNIVGSVDCSRRSLLVFNSYWSVLCGHCCTAAESKEISERKMQNATGKIVFGIDEPVDIDLSAWEEMMMRGSYRWNRSNVGGRLSDFVV